MKFLTTLLLVSSLSYAAPTQQMNEAFEALVRLLPFLINEKDFVDVKKQTEVTTSLRKLKGAFTKVRHQDLLKDDIFSPSYELVSESLTEASVAFEKGHKDYAFWRLKEVTSFCIDCHTRIPKEVTSSYQNSGLYLKKDLFQDTYNRGIASLIVRRYTDATAAFRQTIQEGIIKKDHSRTTQALKNLVIIDAKILRNLNNLETELISYSKKDLPPQDVTQIQEWLTEIKTIKKSKWFKVSYEDNQINLIFSELKGIRNSHKTIEKNDIKILISSGLLSQHSFLNPRTASAPEINFWLGWSEKQLKRENFFSSGNNFFKQCIRKYPKSAIAKDCLAELKESIEFDFTGSAGTHIPKEVKNELVILENLMK
jgi:hypothetical protein